jgi:hypothetical protein
VAHPEAGINADASRNRNELPAVPLRVKLETKDTVAAEVPSLAVGLRQKNRRERTPPGSNNELANSTSRVSNRIGCLRSEALIIMIVTCYDDVGVELVQRTENVLHDGYVAVKTRAEDRIVPVSERAMSGARGKIGAKPLLLNGARTSVDVAVE